MKLTINAAGNREINYMRISITDRCNFRCSYCMPSEGVECKPRDEIMSYEDILEVVRIAVSEGITTFRITGGEPLVRLGVENLIDSIDDVEGCREITMTSNGYLLGDKAEELAEAGLDRVNISLDTLQDKKFAEITGVDGLSRVLDGIEKARNAGLNPLKINTVVKKELNDDEIEDFVRFARNKNLNLRFIEYMPFAEEASAESGCDAVSEYQISLEEIKARVENKHELKPADIRGKGPAQNFWLDNSEAVIGFISPVSHNICGNCNRLRLTADGKIRPCLARENEISLYEGGELKSHHNIRDVLRGSALKKPAENDFKPGCNNRNMSQIGG